MDKVKINLFGESWSLKELELEDNLKLKIYPLLYESSNKFTNQLLELSFYEQLNIPGIKSIADLPGTSVKGLQKSPKSQVEIWLNGKKVIKIKLADLFHQNTLFKLYQTVDTLVDFDEMGEGIYVFEKEIGLTACYDFTVDKFNINLLTFGLLIVQHEGLRSEILTEIFWDNKLLKSKKSDTILRNSNCYVKFS